MARENDRTRHERAVTRSSPVSAPLAMSVCSESRTCGEHWRMRVTSSIVPHEDSLRDWPQMAQYTSRRWPTCSANTVSVSSINCARMR